MAEGGFNDENSYLIDHLPGQDDDEDEDRGEEEVDTTTGFQPTGASTPYQLTDLNCPLISELLFCNISCLCLLSNTYTFKIHVR